MRSVLAILTIMLSLLAGAPATFAGNGAGSIEKAGSFCRSTIGWLRHTRTIRQVADERTQEHVFTSSFGMNVPDVSETDALGTIKSWIKDYKSYSEVREIGEVATKQIDERLKDLTLVYNLAHNSFDHWENRKALADHIGKLREEIEALESLGPPNKESLRKIFILNYRINQLSETLSLSEQGQLQLPIMVHLTPSPATETTKDGRKFIVVHSSDDLFPGKMKFWKPSALAKQIKKERAHKKELEQIQRAHDIQQAIRKWQLETFLDAFTLSPNAEVKAESELPNKSLGEQELIAYREAKRLLESNRADLVPPPDATTTVRHAIAFDQTTANQRLRRMIETTVKPVSVTWHGMKWLHQRLDNLTTPWKIITVGMALNVGLSGIWWLGTTAVETTWNYIYYDKAEREENARNEEMKANAFKIAGVAEDISDFFNRFYTFSIEKYRDESIELATEFMLGNRASLEPDGIYPVSKDPKTGVETNYYKEAQEIVDFFKVLVAGKVDKDGKWIIEGVGGRMQRREANNNRIQQLRSDAERDGLRRLLEQFGTAEPLGAVGQPHLAVPGPQEQQSPIQAKNLQNLETLKDIAQKGGLKDILENAGRSQSQPTSDEPDKP